MSITISFDEPTGRDRGKPPLTARQTKLLQAEIDKLWDGVRVSTRGCTQDACAARVVEIQSFVKAIADVNLRCTKKCKRVLVNGKWESRCTFSCSAKGMRVAGDFRV